VFTTGVSPDGSTLLLFEAVGQTEFNASLWEKPVLGGSPRPIGEVKAVDASWSPDGNSILYASGTDLLSINSDGSGKRKILTAPDQVSDPVWSPDGSKIRYRVSGRADRLGKLWEADANGANAHELLPGWHSPPNECCGKWTPDGSYYVFQSAGTLWALPDKTGFLQKRSTEPIQLTYGPMAFSTPLPSRDGKKLFAVGYLQRGELTRYDMKTGTFAPFLSGISADSVAFSKDGQWVAYVSFPDATLWRAKVDGNEKLQLTFPPMVAVLPGWSPDGQQIVFYTQTAGQKTRIYVVPSSGGTPRELTPSSQEAQWDAVWSPDGTRIVSGGVAADPNSTIQIYDVNTHQVTTVPQSKGLFSPRWSPDGRTIAAMTHTSGSLLLYDMNAQKWKELMQTSIGFPNWSKTGEYIYFLREGDAPAVMRIRVRDRKIERVADLKNFPQTGFYNVWLALAPDDSPLLLRDMGTHEIYALDWQTR